METSEDLLCQYYYGKGNQWSGNGTKHKMRRFLSEIFLDQCQMIEMCSVNSIVDFLRSQSKIIYQLYIT